jgi:hypothetical protein
MPETGSETGAGNEFQVLTLDPSSNPPLARLPSLPGNRETPGAPWGLDAGKGTPETRAFSLLDPPFGYTYILK